MLPPRPWRRTGTPIVSEAHCWSKKIDPERLRLLRIQKDSVNKQAQSPNSKILAENSPGWKNVICEYLLSCPLRTSCKPGQQCFFPLLFFILNKKGTRPSFYKDTLTMPPGWQGGSTVLNGYRKLEICYLTLDLEKCGIIRGRGCWQLYLFV